MTSSSSSTGFCFNLNCGEGSEKWRRGWPRRTGDYAHLCDRCASAYEEGNFCETFHLDASGWRSCESCGKKIHCGCIVSFHMFVLLDAGGIECLTCAKKSDILTPNPAWPPPSRSLPSQPERMKDLSVKTLSATVGSGPEPWNPAPNLFNGFTIPSNVQPRMPFEIDLLGGMDRFRICQRFSTASLGTKDNSFERLVDGKSRIGPRESFVNGASCKEQSNSSINDFGPITFPKNDSAVGGSFMAATSSKNEANDSTQISAILSQPFTPSIQVGKQIWNHNRVGSSSEVQPCNGKTRGDDRGRGQLLPRYRPQITDEELQQISTDSNSVITPLFEKLLTASDAGRIGRLVLPKKCAEAYFPPIAQPEGLPLEVRDATGKEWVFQFRFWPNNNSRMYVLEGITPCLQSLQLQAGDTVTFSRLEPEGKLIMGCRKASIMPSFDQGDEASLFGNNESAVVEDDIIKNRSGEVISINGNLNGKSHQRFPLINQVAKSDPRSAGSIVKSTFNSKKILETKPMTHNNRKNSTLGTKSKRLRIENEDIMELKLTWEEAQLLMRPPPKIVPSVFVIEGFEIEEFEEAAPIIGRPTIPVVDNLGLKIQWAQCEECFKWRKVPADALLSSRWTCSENAWDLGRSLCSASEELFAEQLNELLPTISKVSFEKNKTTEHHSDLFVGLEGLDALANLAIQGKGESLPHSSPTRTKHPRHKPGCSCIVCIQPPSGKGLKHKQSCECAVCSSLRRRFRTLMERREKKQLEKESESLPQQQLPEQQLHINAQPSNNAGNNDVNLEDSGNVACVDEHNGNKPAVVPLKGQIDLNIQPEREEELSPVSNSGAMKCVSTGSTQEDIGGLHLPSDTPVLGN
ncbi:B3 domain-containing protein Os07g0563300-like isoform X1 [Primulina huaijiensis]|uniref:B3 domain-containing protein Os07g0563300-like isoform X1 n=1 Tax=Primulina huaijiensis TaxID=1492673 RepID=UPI003CC6EE25